MPSLEYTTFEIWNCEVEVFWDQEADEVCDFVWWWRVVRKDFGGGGGEGLSDWRGEGSVWDFWWWWWWEGEEM